MNIATLPTKGERTRAHIVATAATLFWRRNFHGVSVDQVAEAAQVNKATIYRYFADKGELALAVIKYNGAISLEVIFAETFDTHSLPQDRLAAIYRQIYCAHLEMQRESGDLYGCPIIGLALELGQEMPQVREEAQRLFEKVEQHFTQIAADAIEAAAVQGDPRVLGRTLTQLLHGAFASARVAKDPDRLLDAGKAALALIGFSDTPIVLPEDRTL